MTLIVPLIPLMLGLGPGPEPAADRVSPRLAVGVLGDSYSDEYQFYPPDRSVARNWVEILAATRDLNFGAFSAEPRPEPRNQGFAYNWARSEATTADVLAAGQHLGLADQLARGEVQVAVVFIGGNDFIGAIRSPDPSAAIAAAGPRAMANYREIVATLRRAAPKAGLVLVTVPDIRGLPDVAALIASGAVSAEAARACSAAIGRYNGQIRALVRRDPEAVLIDLDLTDRALSALRRDAVPFGGAWLDRTRPGNEVDRVFLADLRHTGTLTQGLFAQMLVDALNARYRAGLAPLAFAEVRGLAESVAPAAGALTAALTPSPGSPPPPPAAR